MRWRAKNPEKYKIWRSKRNKKKEKNTHLMRTYGITLEEYEATYEAQKGLCIICNKKEFTKLGKHILHVDHCHKSLSFRGLLCNGCNRGLGFFGDSIRSLEQATKYLKSWEGR